MLMIEKYLAESTDLVDLEQRQQQLAPLQSLQNYASLVTPIASGFPTTVGAQQTQANPLTTALGGAVLGAGLPGVGALVGGGLGLLGGLL